MIRDGLKMRQEEIATIALSSGFYESIKREDAWKGKEGMVPESFPVNLKKSGFRFRSRIPDSK